MNSASLLRLLGDHNSSKGQRSCVATLALNSILNIKKEQKKVNEVDFSDSLLTCRQILLVTRCETKLSLCSDFEWFVFFHYCNLYFFFKYCF